ncbi:hypothetical protein ACFLS7_00820 [Bacteroidota bacterium]
MKTKKLIFSLLLSCICVFGVQAQSTADYEVCQGSSEDYWIESASTGSSFSWSISPGSSGTEWSITENNNDSIIVLWSSPGTYSVEVVETSADGCDGDPVTLQVAVSELPTTADAGSNQVICSSLDAVMAGNTALVGSGTWSQVSGPGTITFTDATSPGTAVTASVYGTYVLRWTISNGACAESTDDMTIKFSPKPLTNGIWHQ